MPSQADVRMRSRIMKKLALVAALVLAASPVAAQQQPLGAGGQTNTSPLTCNEEMTATFCTYPAARELQLPLAVS